MLFLLDLCFPLHVKFLAGSHLVAAGLPGVSNSSWKVLHVNLCSQDPTARSPATKLQQLCPQFLVWSHQRLCQLPAGAGAGAGVRTVMDCDGLH